MSDHVVVIGGGPGGYEAALVAAQLGADVTVVDTDGLGGSAVLTDCVPSKTLIATAELMTDVHSANELGVMIGEDGVRVDLARVNQRVKALAQAQSEDIAQRLEKEGVQVLQGRGSLAGLTGPTRRPVAGDEIAAWRTPSWSPPAPRRASCPPRSRTASGS